MAYVDLNTKWVEHWVSAHKEVIALNKEGFENVKVSTLIAIQICAFEILNIHDPKRIFSIITRIRSDASLPYLPLDRLANVTLSSITYIWNCSNICT